MNLKQYFWPRSLLSRTLVLTILSVFIAQAVASLFWYTQSKQREVEGLKAASESMAQVFASTTSFFQSLPAEYRHIALEQLRNMGGARFFVSFNTEEIRIDPIPDTISKREAVDTIQGVMEQKLPNVENILINFSRPETLRVLNNNLLLSDLPKSWAHHTLTLEPLNPPVLVVQIELDTNQWVYIAALLPAPYVTLENDLVNADQLVFLVAITLLLLIFTFTLIRNQTRPLKRLALAANRLSTDIEQPELVEEGASEITTVTRAFNLMQKRMQRYMHDREKLFGSISHDLKTPITRLRLRAELIDNEVQAAKINKDLDELEIMVKGALQTVKDTDIHENVTNIDVLNILKSVAEIHNQQRQRVFIRGAQDLPFSCKPLAFKRCLTNLIDNSVKYGDEVTVYVQDSEKSLDITLIDNGPGIPEEHLKKVFDPYFRLHTDVHGTGLGLGIAKNIIRAHGGEIILSNRQSGGLQIDIAFPKVEQ
ncbi:ATP-binding protein [Enterovibrio norvegicus]|uniref:histidine kinase n=2 Tax=Enterovibrio norvegicus TaxID=188144 RepID=A0A1I5VX88_9GAMM|nr:ATP-binding protein [Enterovibrio norvegicus]OEE60756.1 two-component sensor histidine kinase [Enterovibrio norvegicus]OEF58215.1 two-component sensor histidine kinase [Enterovibrio norvegicus]PMI31713.1 two-component sensor histidine kinase [Enterovibrio norvegicus]TKF15238.1 HAMP domain-containing protein [Enterovibrio norvegicus]TKF35274.1 HAMP domain-containing protein [Enterovibrio norvegicus]